MMKTKNQPDFEAMSIDELRIEAAKLYRSRKYWETRVRDEEKKECFARQEKDWKEFNHKITMDASQYGETVKKFREDTRAYMAKMYDLQRPMPMDIWRRLMQLAHPDKHDGSAVSIEATRWLIDNKPNC